MPKRALLLMSIAAIAARKRHPAGESIKFDYGWWPLSRATRKAGLDLGRGTKHCDAQLLFQTRKPCNNASYLSVTGFETLQAHSVMPRFVLLRLHSLLRRRYAGTDSLSARHGSFSPHVLPVLPGRAARWRKICALEQNAHSHTLPVMLTTSILSSWSGDWVSSPRLLQTLPDDRPRRQRKQEYACHISTARPPTCQIATSKFLPWQPDPDYWTNDVKMTSQPRRPCQSISARPKPMVLRFHARAPSAIAPLLVQ